MASFLLKVNIFFFYYSKYLRTRVEVGAEALQIDGLEVQPHLRA